METERLQMRVKSETKDIFQSICQNQNIKSSELFKKMLMLYCLDQDRKDYEMYLAKKTYEYIALLVKGSHLPRDDSTMNDLILAESRFDKLIEEKINNGQK